jgi:hypothetical protein
MDYGPFTQDELRQIDEVVARYRPNPS